MTKLTKIEQNIQAILFAAGEPYEKERLAKLLEIDCQTLAFPAMAASSAARSSGRRWRSRTTLR